MAIINKPGTINKGVNTNITLDKTELRLLPYLVQEGYFNDFANWKTLSLNYKSSPGNQPAIVHFDASQAIPVGVFFAHARARTVFEIQSIHILDLAGGSILIPRSAIPFAEFDITLT